MIQSLPLPTIEELLLYRSVYGTLFILVGGRLFLIHSKSKVNESPTAQHRTKTLHKEDPLNMVPVDFKEDRYSDGENRGSDETYRSKSCKMDNKMSYEAVPLPTEGRSKHADHVIHLYSTR